MTRVKICGQTRPADVAASVAAGADALGFIVDVPVDTPRDIAAGRARELIDDTPPFVAAVLVTMATDPDHLVELLAETGADTLQAHADVSPADLRAVGERAGVRTLKTVGAADPGVAHRYEDTADALLIDSDDEDGGGGTGNTGDWEQTRELARGLGVPVVLAGGLTPENVGEAVRTVEPYGVDVATGVERTGGVKDHDAVAAFVDNAR
jgi:phosphoribosylanthranilate isomerase